VVLPYREASQSGIIAAAHGLGVPVVATPVGALPDQIRNGVDGIIARAVNAEALADALAIICDRSKRAALTSGAQESSVRLNDWDSIAGNFLSILKAASR
jgi:glycosyltransferase involved in cell wall biosynthesis